MQRIKKTKKKRISRIIITNINENEDKKSLKVTTALSNCDQLTSAKEEDRAKRNIDLSVFRDKDESKDNNNNNRQRDKKITSSVIV